MLFGLSEYNNLSHKQSHVTLSPFQNDFRNHKTILSGRDFWWSSIPVPTQSRVNFKVRSGGSGLYLVGGFLFIQ